MGNVRYWFRRQFCRVCVSVVGLCSRIVADLNLVDHKKYSGAILLSESGFEFQTKIVVLI